MTESPCYGSVSRGDELDLEKMMEDIQNSMIGNHNKLCQRVEQSQMGHHNGKTVQEPQARLRGMTK